ncbi:MAG: glycoside hydrolase family 3 N-terminal domain-containing protein, partial [Butyricicoccaceae bacterium]
LRGELGYDGLVITDAMNMGAITKDYDSAEAAVAAIEAGVDIVLMPEDFQKAYEGVLTAVKEGTLTEERIDESVSRIIAEKLRMQNQSLNSDVVG